MSEAWSFLSRPDFWFVNVVLALLLNIASQLLIIWFPRWIAALGSWKKVLDLVLVGYVLAVLAWVGAGIVVGGQTGYGPFTSVVDGYLNPGITIVFPTLVVFQEHRVAIKLLFLSGTFVVAVAAAYVCLTASAPITLGGSLIVFSTINFLLLLVLALTFMFEMAWWLFRVDFLDRFPRKPK